MSHVRDEKAIIPLYLAGARPFLRCASHFGHSYFNKEGVRMCMHTSLYVEESSARVTGALRDLDSMTYQERVTKGGLLE